MSSYQYMKSHCGDKTILRPSYLHNGISYTERKTSLYAAEEKKLYDYLIRDYNRDIRPVITQSNTTTVAVGLGLARILDVNIAKGYIELSVWIRQTWSDSFLTWDTADFGGLNHISVPSNKLWQPDINLMNSMYEGQLTQEKINLAIVYNNGTVLFIRPAHIRVFCVFSMYHFPRDQQSCEVKFASWTYDTNTLAITFYKDDPKVDLSEHKPSPDWDIQDTSVSRSSTTYACCPEIYPEVTFSLTIKRTSDYFYGWFIRPLILLFFLLPFTFLLPPADKTKILAILLAVVTLVVFLVERQMPSESMPMLGHMYIALMASTVVATLLAILTYHLTTKDGGPPRLIKTVVVDVLGRLLCIRGPSGGAASSDVGMTSMDPHSPDNASDKTDMETQTVLPQQKKTLPQEWKLIARVLDRLMFFIFLVICFICILFLWAYY